MTHRRHRRHRTPRPPRRRGAARPRRRTPTRSSPPAAASTGWRTSPTAASGPRRRLRRPRVDRGRLRRRRQGCCSSPAATVGQRVPQHRNVVEAGPEAGVGLVAYTSIAERRHAPTLQLAAEHQETEQILRRLRRSARPAPQQLVPRELHRPGPTLPRARRASLGSAGERPGQRRHPRRLRRGRGGGARSPTKAGTDLRAGRDEAFTMAELAAAVRDAAGTVGRQYRRPARGRVRRGPDRRRTARGLRPCPGRSPMSASPAAISCVTTGDLSRLIGRPDHEHVGEAVRARRLAPLAAVVADARGRKRHEAGRADRDRTVRLRHPPGGGRLLRGGRPAWTSPGSTPTGSSPARFATVGVGTRGSPPSAGAEPAQR